MKKILTFIFLHFFVIAVQAQTTHGRINGKVIDEQTKQPVDYATIGIYKQGASSPFTGISTDPKGNFTLNNLPEGDYKLVVDFVGYQRTTVDHVTITKSQSTVVLNNIILKSAQHQLKNVVITAKAPVVENKIDRLVYNAENDVTAQGGVALDVLKKVPMISVDIDGNVELQGNSNIRFLINGKPSSIFGANLADALQAIPASQIKSIEVITNPGAKYDATGTGGIVNIILKESRIQGYNGSVNLSAGTRLENGSLNLNVRRGKFGAGVYFAGNDQLNTTTNSTNNRQSYNNTRDTVTNLLQQGHSTTKRHGYQTGFHFQWDITKKESLNGSIGYNNFGSNSNGFSNQQQDEIVAGNTLSNVISQRISNNQSSNHAVDWSLAYKKTFKKEGQELDILYNSSLNNNSSKFLQNQFYPNGDYPTSGTASTNPGTDHETDISIDYTQPVSKTVIIETGAKAVVENLNNNVNTDTLLNNGSFIPDADQTYGFNYKRNIYAAYLSSSFSLFKFIDGKVGLRDEYTSTSEDYGDTQIPSYNTLAPSFVLSHKMGETGALRFSYSYRIQRPSYGDLNPFYNISDPHNISTGNPDLKPVSGHNYELSYNNSFNGGAHMFVSAFYHHNTDDLQSITTFYDVLTINGVDYPDVSLTKRYNIGTQTQEGINFFGALPVIKDKLNLRTNIMVAERSDSNPGVQTVSGVYYRANMNISYNFGHDLIAEAFGNYNSSQKNIQGQRPSFAFYNIAMRKQFLNKKLSIGVTASDPFNNYINQKSTTYGSNFYQTNYRQVPYRTFGISLNYKFGKLEFKKVEDKDNDENTPKPLEN